MKHKVSKKEGLKMSVFHIEHQTSIAAYSPMIEAQNSRKNDKANTIWAGQQYQASVTLFSKSPGGMWKLKTTLHVPGHRDIRGGIKTYWCVTLFSEGKTSDV